jgi:hypothetical protein
MKNASERGCALPCGRFCLRIFTDRNREATIAIRLRADALRLHLLVLLNRNHHMIMERMTRERRLGIPLPVEFECAGLRVTGVAGNISRHGVYVRTEAGIGKDEIVKLGIALPNGMTAQVLSRAVHSLELRTAQALGQRAGVGFRFIDEDSLGLHAIGKLIDEVSGQVSPLVGEVAEPLRLTVVSSDARLLDRMTTVLGDNGYAVEAASSSFEAYVLCFQHTPELIVVGEYMASLEGPTLAVQFDHGKVDIKVLRLKKPFTDEELCAQVATALGKQAWRSSLRANLHEIPLGSLLSFLESTRKTGVVTAVRGDRVVELHARDGRIVSIMQIGEADAHSFLLDLLDWQEGIFQFYPCPIVDLDQIHCSTETLLSEHTRTHHELAQAQAQAL